MTRFAVDWADAFSAAPFGGNGCAVGQGGLHQDMPFHVALRGATGAVDTVVRLPLAPPGLPEDPFTGSATGAMVAYL